MIHKTAIVAPSARIGEGTNVWAFSQIREDVVIGRGSTIGVQCYIERGIEIGDNVKLIGAVILVRPLKIEDDVFIGPAVIFTNDKSPRHDKIRDLTGVKRVTKKGASVGAGALIMPDINIGRYALVGAGSIVTKDVPDHGLVYGSPAKLRGFVCFCGEKISTSEGMEADGKTKCVCSHCKKEVFIKKEDLRLLV